MRTEIYADKSNQVDKLTDEIKNDNLKDLKSMSSSFLFGDMNKHIGWNKFHWTKHSCFFRFQINSKSLPSAKFLFEDRLGWKMCRLEQKEQFLTEVVFTTSTKELIIYYLILFGFPH